MNSCFIESNLKAHVASVHEGKKPLKCDSCDYKSFPKTDLNRHIVSVHEGNKPFKCEIYQQTTTTKQTLKNHVSPVHEKRSLINVNSVNTAPLGKIT